MQVDPEGMDHMVTFQLEVIESFLRLGTTIHRMKHKLFSVWLIYVC